MMVPLTTDLYATYLDLCREAGVSPNIIGASGIGKSQMLTQYHGRIQTALAAKGIEFGLLDTLLSQTDPVDLRGFGFPKRDYRPRVFVKTPEGDVVPLSADSSGPLNDGPGGTTEFLPLKHIPWVGNKNVPERGIWRLDEVDNGQEATVAAFSSVVSDHIIGDLKIKPKWWIVTAMNGRAVNAYSKDLSGPFKRRLCHAYLVPSVESLKKYATATGWHPAVVKLLERRGGGIMPATPDYEDMAVPQRPDGSSDNPSPRQLEYYSSILKVIDKRPDVYGPVRFQAMQGVLGLAVACEEATALAMDGHCPTLDDILNGSVVVPDQQWQHYLSLSFAMMALPKRVENGSGRKCVAYLKLCLDSGVSRDLIRLGVSCLGQTYPDVWGNAWALEFA
jgi:hypothetical protein